MQDCKTLPRVYLIGGEVTSCSYQMTVLNLSKIELSKCFCVFFAFCHNLSFSFVKFEFLHFVTIWVFEFCRYLSSSVLSQFKLSQFSQFKFLNFVTISVFKFSHNLGLVTIKCLKCHSFSFWFFFLHNLSFWVVTFGFF